jgi:hypothetical protein
LVYSSEQREFLTTFEPEITISVKLGRPSGIEFGDPIFRTKRWTYYSKQNYSVIRIVSPEKTSRNSHYTIVLETESRVGSLFLEDITTTSSREVISIIMPPHDFEAVLAVQLLGMKRGVMFHACGLRTMAGTGLLFSGVSGAGKSTTVNLWLDAGKADLIGDECITVRKRDGRFWLINTAWHGSGQVTGPSEIPLDRLFILHHADTNHARLLKPSEAISLLFSRAFLPFWDRAGMEFTLEFLDELCSSIPCYNYGFTLDPSAVEYVECLISS